MLSTRQAHAIGQLVAELRPDWPKANVVGCLESLRDREPGAVALAAIRAALDPGAKTPRVIPSNGSHWHDDQPATDQRRPAGPLCDICSRPEAQCCALPTVADDEGDSSHAFTPRHSPQHPYL